MLERVNSEYHEVLAKRPKKYQQDLNYIYQKLDSNEVYYEGEVIPILYQPLFFNQAIIDQLTELTERLGLILKKVIEEYLDDPSFRTYFGFSEALEELILVDPGYSNSVPMARFDIFYYGNGNPKFCELNADGSSGMVKTNILEKYFLKSEAIQDLVNKYEYEFTHCELLNSWIDNMLTNYNEFYSKDDSGLSKEKPNIAIMDFDNLGMVSEFKHFEKLLNEQGYKTVIVDPRELNYQQGNLYYQDLRIDLIYRRAVTTELMERYSEISDLLTAYKEGTVCIVGPLRSQIIHNKVIFSILHDEEKTEFLSEIDREFINKHIPYTAIVTNNQEQLEYIRKNRRDLVLKPLDFYGAQGVYIGRDLEQSKWESVINNIDFTKQRYLVQEFCLVPELEMALLSDQQLKIESFKYTLGLFMYNLNFAGIYTRAGKDNVIASSTGCVTLPNLILKNI